MEVGKWERGAWGSFLKAWGAGIVAGRGRFTRQSGAPMGWLEVGGGDDRWCPLSHLSVRGEREGSEADFARRRSERAGRTDHTYGGERRGLTREEEEVGRP